MVAMALKPASGPGGDAALLLAAYGARTHCGSSSELHEADISRENHDRTL